LLSSAVLATHDGRSVPVLGQPVDKFVGRHRVGVQASLGVGDVRGPELVGVLIGLDASGEGFEIEDGTHRGDQSQHVVSVDPIGAVNQGGDFNLELVDGQCPQGG
jgi:hypothetical protein